jgi:flagellar protein FliO/FliZ
MAVTSGTRVTWVTWRAAALAGRMRLAFAIISGVCLAAVASAAEKPFAAPQVAEHVPATTAGGLLQVTLSLLLVLAAVFGAAWVTRRLRGFGNASSRAIQIIADAPLGTKERAVLIQVGGQQLLVGVAPGHINLLHVLTEKVGDGQVGGTPPGPLHGADTASPMRPDFKAILKRSLGL